MNRIRMTQDGIPTCACPTPVNLPRRKMKRRSANLMPRVHMFSILFLRFLRFQFYFQFCFYVFYVWDHEFRSKIMFCMTFYSSIFNINLNEACYPRRKRRSPGSTTSRDRFASATRASGILCSTQIIIEIISIHNLMSVTAQTFKNEKRL